MADMRAKRRQQIFILQRLFCAPPIVEAVEFSHWVYDRRRVTHRSKKHPPSLKFASAECYRARVMGSGKFNVLEGAHKFSSQNFENDRDRNKRNHPCLEICWRVNDISHPNTRLGICFLCIYRLLRRYEWVINLANHVCICNLYCAQQTHRLIKDTAWSADTSLSITIIRDLRRRPQPKRMQRREARPGSSHCTKVHSNILPTSVMSGYSVTLWNLNFSRNVAGITKWFWGTIEGYLSYLLPKFEELVPTSLGSGAI